MRNDDREADILYLAHQLWEEMDAPDMAPQACWSQAARQILARPQPAPCTPEASRARYQRYAQAGLVCLLDQGVAPQCRSITFVKGCTLPEPANQSASRARRTAD